jgi:hypothetical protein
VHRVDITVTVIVDASVGATFTQHAPANRV